MIGVKETQIRPFKLNTQLNFCISKEFYPFIHVARLPRRAVAGEPTFGRVHLKDEAVDQIMDALIAIGIGLKRVTKSTKGTSNLTFLTVCPRSFDTFLTVRHYMM